MIVYGPESEFRIADENLSLGKIALRYQPVLYLHSEIDYMRPIQVLYEAEPAGESLRINYYVHWMDEIAPNPLWHRIYSVIRTVRYGSTQDIEFIQIVVSCRTGRARSMVFEYDPSGRPDAPMPMHHLVAATRIADGDEFSVTVRDIPAQTVRISGEADRLPILVPVWNHIYDFYRGVGVRMDDPPLNPMTEQFYAKYYMGRRSLPPGR
jgi:hypothetical protein